MQFHNDLYNTSKIFIVVSYRKRDFDILITLIGGMMASKTVRAIQAWQAPHQLQPQKGKFMVFVLKEFLIPFIILKRKNHVCFLFCYLDGTILFVVQNRCSSNWWTIYYVVNVQENGHSKMYTWILSTGWWETRAPVNPDAVVVVGFLCICLIGGFIYINRWFYFRLLFGFKKLLKLRVWFLA